MIYVQREDGRELSDLDMENQTKIVNFVEHLYGAVGDYHTRYNTPLPKSNDFWQTCIIAVLGIEDNVEVLAAFLEMLVSTYPGLEVTDGWIIRTDLQ